MSYHNNEVIKINAGKIIKELRQRSNLTQEQLGEILGVKKSAIQKYENGSIQNLKIDTIRMLCDTFKVPPYVFIYPKKYDEAIFDEKNEELYYALYRHYGESVFEMLFKFFQLNEENKSKAMQYISDLNKIDEYRL